MKLLPVSAFFLGRPCYHFETDNVFSNFKFVFISRYSYETENEITNSAEGELRLVDDTEVGRMYYSYREALYILLVLTSRNTVLLWRDF